MFFGTLTRWKEALKAAEELGINYIDTAPVYGTGNSERLLGKALKNRRDHFVLQTKVSMNWRNDGGAFKYERDGVTVRNNTHAKAVRQDVEDSLVRLDTDYIDVAVVHYVNNEVAPVEETVNELNAMISEGKIRAFALSNSKPEDYREYAKYGSVSLVQEQFSLLAPYHSYDYFRTIKDTDTVFQVYGALEEGFLTRRDKVDQSYPKTDVRGKLPWFHEPYKSGIHTLFDVMKPMREKYNCSYANIIEAWTLAQYENLNLLIGCRHAETLEDTCKCLNVKLTEEEIALLNETAKPVQVKELDK